jgi:GntR family transcriptional regulator
MQFHIQPSAALPIYRQIVEQVRRHVASGQWRAGDELPSVRALALEHAINPMTAAVVWPWSSLKSNPRHAQANV